VARFDSWKFYFSIGEPFVISLQLFNNVNFQPGIAFQEMITLHFSTDHVMPWYFMVSQWIQLKSILKLMSQHLPTIFEMLFVHFLLWA